MNRPEYLLTYGDRLTNAPTVLFVHDSEKITVYSKTENARKTWQAYVDKKPGITIEALASRFTYVNTDFGPIIGKKKLEIEKMIKGMSAVIKPVTAAFPGDDAWRSAKAKLQRRDRYGRFAEMGGGFSFALRKRDGSMSRVTGKVVGQSGEENVDVEVKDNDALPNGVYSVPASKGEAVKAVINLKGLDDAKVDKSKSSTVFPADTPFVTEAEIGKAPETPKAPETSEVSDTSSSAVEKTLQHNKEVLERAPEFGRPSQEFIDAANQDGRFTGTYGKLATTQEHAAFRREQMLKRIQAIREQIQTNRDQLSPLEFDQRIFDTILEKTDEELIAMIEEAALKIARGRIPGGRVWGHSSLLDKVLEEGYRSKNDTAGDVEGGHLLTLTGTRGAVETQTGIPLDSGLRPTYGFSDYTFWEEERQRIAAERDASGLYSSDYMISVNGKNGGGPLDNGFAGACDGYGDMEFILRPEVDERSAVHFGDSLLDKGWAVGAAGATDEEAIESVIGHLETGHMNRNINNLLRTVVTGDFVNWNRSGDGTSPGTYTETQTLDGFDANDIEAIRFDGMRVFPTYKDRFNPDGLDGAQEIADIAAKYLTVEKMREAGYTPTEIEYALNIIEEWKSQNAPGTEGRSAATNIIGLENLNKLVLARERKRVEAKIKEKAPHVKVLFGSPTGINYENPESYGGNPGDSVEDILGLRVLKDLLSEVKRKIEWATAPDDDDESWV